MLRNAALVAGASLDTMIRARRFSRGMLIGGGLLATGVVAALAHMAGADLRGWMVTGQPGAVPGLIDVFANDDAGARP